MNACSGVHSSRLQPRTANAFDTANLGMRRAPRKTICGELLGVEAGLIPLLDKLVDLHSVSPVMMTKLVSTGKRPPAGWAQ